MELEHGIFAAKLHEMKQEYLRIQGRLRLYQGQDLEQVHRERERLQAEYQAQDRLLEETARSCRSPAMARLAKLQRDYGRQAEELLQRPTGSGRSCGSLRGICHGSCHPGYAVCTDHRPKCHGTSNAGRQTYHGRRNCK